MNDTAKTIAVALPAAVALLIVVGSCQASVEKQEEHREDFNSWIAECIGQDGTPTLTHVQENGSNWYECMVEGKEVQIP